MSPDTSIITTHELDQHQSRSEQNGVKYQRWSLRSRRTTFTLGWILAVCDYHQDCRPVKFTGARTLEVCRWPPKFSTHALDHNRIKIGFGTIFAYDLFGSWSRSPVEIYSGGRRHSDLFLRFRNFLIKKKKKKKKKKKREVEICNGNNKWKASRSLRGKAWGELAHPLRTDPIARSMHCSGCTDNIPFHDAEKS